MPPWALMPSQKNSYPEADPKATPKTVQIGKIQLLQIFLDFPVSSDELLALSPADELDSTRQRLLAEYGQRFKRS